MFITKQESFLNDDSVQCDNPFTRTSIKIMFLLLRLPYSLNRQFIFNQFCLSTD